LTSALLTPPVPESPVESFIHDVTGPSAPRNFAGFNLVIFSPTVSEDDRNTTYHYSTPVLVTNRGGNGEISSHTLKDSLCDGISNSVDGTPEWEKVTEGKGLFRDILHHRKATEDEETLVEQLFDLMRYLSHAVPPYPGTLPADISSIPSRQSPTPPAKWGELRYTIAVPPFSIPKPTPELYGTRLSTVILIRPTGEVTFVERDIWKIVGETGEVVKGTRDDDRKFHFKLETSYSV
jgi:uncharacterized protein with NRDE domain